MTNTLHFNCAWGLFREVYKHRNNIGQCTPYSEYSESTQKVVRNMTKSILDMISGGDTYQLLSELLRPEGVAKLYPCDEVCSHDINYITIT